MTRDSKLDLAAIVFTVFMFVCFWLLLVAMVKEAGAAW